MPKSIYSPMLLCIFGQIRHFSKYLAEPIKSQLTGVILPADKENGVEKLKFFESRYLNPKFPNFQLGHRLLGLCLTDLDADEHSNLFTIVIFRKQGNLFYNKNSENYSATFSN